MPIQIDNVVCCCLCSKLAGKFGGGGKSLSLILVVVLFGFSVFLPFSLAVLSFCRTSELNEAFKDTLKLPHSLHKILSYFSSPVTLSEVREMCYEVKDMYTDEVCASFSQWRQ